MSVDFSTLTANKSSFTPGQKTKIFISTAYQRGATVPTKTLTLAVLSSAVGTGATATVTVVSGSITAIQITNGGSGYIDGAVIAFTGTGGSGASAELTTVGGVVTGYTNLVGGTGYPTSATTAAITGYVNSTGAVAVNDIEIALSAPTSVDLYEGTRIEFMVNGVSTPVYVSQLTPHGVSAIPIEPSQYAIPTAFVGTIYAWVPVFSANQTNLDNSATVIAEQNFSAGLYTQKAVTQLDAKGTTQGIQVFQDPGLAILNQANAGGNQVVVEVVKPFQRGVRRFEAIIGGLPESIQKNQFIQQTINLEASGAVTKYEN
jgi:hypothetical protein